MSGWSARNFAAFLLQDWSGQSQVVVGILFSSEEQLWSVSVHTSVAEAQAYTTSSGMELVAVEVPEDQLVQSMPSQIGELVEQADVEAVVGLEGRRGLVAPLHVGRRVRLTEPSSCVSSDEAVAGFLHGYGRQLRDVGPCG